MAMERAEEDEALLAKATLDPVKEEEVKADAVATKPAKTIETIFMVDFV